MDEKKDLRWFIQENYKLLTAMGVFGGLTTLFTRLENASYLAFLSLMMFLVLSYEVWTAFPKSKTAITLIIFENLSLTLVGGVLVYILLYYYVNLMIYLPILGIAVVGFLYVTSLRAIIASFRLRHKTTSKVLRFSGYAAALIISIIVGSVISAIVNHLQGFT